ncbi:hypothetical protein [Spirillospora sp. NPDC047279]|uniref:hypothetical protein n=1 Tax=Spirillospora sp. NPDC047279 TaxID=3155478 RepID=UPI0033CEC0CF
MSNISRQGKIGGGPGPLGHEGSQVRSRARGGRALPIVIGTAVLGTLVGDVTMLLVKREDDPGPAKADPRDLVSVSGDAMAVQAVTPLTRRLQPSLLIAGSGSLPPATVERARRIKGVAGVTVVDAARAQVGTKRVGLLGVDPSGFRAFAPKQSAESDQLWRMVATGGLAVSFNLSRDGSLPLGGVVTAGSSSKPGQVRVSAYASMGIGDVDAIVSRTQARTLGMPNGNGLVISAPKADRKKLAKALKGILPKGTRIATIAAQSSPVTPAGLRRQPQVSGRPDGVRGNRSIISGNSMTPTMVKVVTELDGMFGAFPVIGCYRNTGDPQDHALGRACDFMETASTGALPSASAQRHGDQVAQYAISNARRLGISYVIWKQHIWNIRFPGWRKMENRGSITQNHYDHVHISVLR